MATILPLRPPAARVDAHRWVELHETFLVDGVPAEDLVRFESMVFPRHSVSCGEHLFNAGDPFTCLYSIRNGSFKTTFVDRFGREQVTGFPLADDLLGIDGLGSGRYTVSAIALEESDVCKIPYALVEAMAQEVPSLHRRLHAAFAREVVRGHGIMMLLGSMGAQERLAAFLLNLSTRVACGGQAVTRLRLRMTRSEIGRHLGLTLETVSRAFSTFRKDGLIDVDKKEVLLVDIKGLEALAAGRSDRGSPR